MEEKTRNVSYVILASYVFLLKGEQRKINIFRPRMGRLYWLYRADDNMTHNCFRECYITIAIVFSVISHIMHITGIAGMFTLFM